MAVWLLAVFRLAKMLIWSNDNLTINVNTLAQRSIVDSYIVINSYSYYNSCYW